MSYGALGNGATLFLDLDGVMADFDGAFPAKFGFDHRTVPDDVMWDRIDSDPRYFRDLPPCKGALEFFDLIRGHFRPIVLTACPAGDKFEHIAVQKHGWVREHLGSDVPVVFVPGGRTKALYMRTQADVLIDDFARNCERWNEAGGYAIHHTGDFTHTLCRLYQIVGEIWRMNRPASATSHARSVAPATTSPATTTATATVSDAATTSTGTRVTGAIPDEFAHRPRC